MFTFSGVPAVALVAEDHACLMLGLCQEHFRKEVAGRIRKFREVDGIHGEGKEYYVLDDIIEEQLHQFERNVMRSADEIRVMLAKVNEIPPEELGAEPEGIREALMWVLHERDNDALLSYVEDVPPTTNEPTVNNVTVDTEGANQD